MKSERKIKVILHGYLKKLCPETHEVIGSSVSEVINGLCKITKAFEVPLGKERHLISVVGYEGREALEEPFRGEETEIHLVPAILGGKNGMGIVKIVIGAVLIAAGIALTPANPIGGPMLTSIGVSLVLSGVIDLISPAPKKDLSALATDVEASKYLPAGANTVKIGTRIPIVYGKIKLYGHYLSFDVDAKDVLV
jgi:predicted phage tail protein